MHRWSVRFWGRIPSIGSTISSAVDKRDQIAELFESYRQAGIELSLSFKKLETIETILFASGFLAVILGTILQNNELSQYGSYMIGLAAPIFFPMLLFKFLRYRRPLDS